jgi:hypothetical protein
VTIFFCLSPPTPKTEEGIKPKNIRWYAKEILENGSYQTFLLLTILASTIQLLLENPIAAESIITESTGTILDWTFLVIFFSEFLLKALMHGIYWEHSQAYFRVVFNWLDFSLLLVQVLEFLWPNGVKSLRILRILRPLRILRLVDKITSLKLILAALATSGSKLLAISLIWGFFYVIFALVGVFLFGGSLYSCSDPTIANWAPNRPGVAVGTGWREDCVGTVLAFRSEHGMFNDGQFHVASYSPTGVLKPRVWSNPHSVPSEVGPHFDNFAAARFQSPNCDCLTFEIELS